ncbi:MAG: hypothetical protein HC788_06705 [Sphingopyxis sp.]|nr:hypothetical protein [Sphingopyxis sp.]
MPKLPPAVIDDSLAIGGEDIDARKQRTRLTVAVKIDDTGLYRFVVNSGADSSVIGTRIARTLQLPAGRAITLNAMTGSSIVPRVLIGELGLGDPRRAAARRASVSCARAADAACRPHRLSA